MTDAIMTGGMMTDGALFWLIVSAVAAVLFFGIAIVVSIRGMGELRQLLSRTGKRKDGKPHG
jgi:hypothetical protein